MKKVVFFISFSILFLSCTKERWNEDRLVKFVLNNDINFNTSDDDISEINCSIQYSIVGETDTVHIQSWSNFSYIEHNFGPQSYSYHSGYYSLKNYDYLEFKLRISCTSHPISSKYTLTAISEMTLNHRLQTDTLTSFNNSDTTIYFTWSPPNFN